MADDTFHLKIGDLIDTQAQGWGLGVVVLLIIVAALLSLRLDRLRLTQSLFRIRQDKADGG